MKSITDKMWNEAVYLSLEPQQELSMPGIMKEMYPDSDVETWMLLNNNRRTIIGIASDILYQQLNKRKRNGELSIEDREEVEQNFTSQMKEHYPRMDANVMKRLLNLSYYYLK